MRYLNLKRILFAAAVIVFTSCEDPVTIEVEDGVAQLAVDGFVNNLAGDQKIILKKSKDFFGSVSQEAATGATVSVTDSEGNIYNFLDADNDGEYIWNDSIMIVEGRTYDLLINYDGEVYTASEVANPVPEIDSLVISELENGFTGEVFPDSFALELFAIDIPDRQDHYWIKLYRNDTIVRSNNIICTYDGAFGPGADGVLFIPPIRVAPVNEDLPFYAGEKARAELHSVSNNTFLFFQQVTNQINNGGLFAVPPANVRTNIVSSSEITEKQAIGIFSVSMVTTEEVDI